MILQTSEQEVAEKTIKRGKKSFIYSLKAKSEIFVVEIEIIKLFESNKFFEVKFMSKLIRVYMIVFFLN